VRVTADRGLVRTMLVDESNHQVVSVEQKFFMGRGDQFKLKMQLDSQKQLSDDESLMTANTLTALLKLQMALGRSPDEQRPELTLKQVNMVNAQLAALERLSTETSFADLVAAIRRDVKSQLKRQTDVANLGKNLVGKVAPPFALTALTGQEIPAKQYRGKPVILHFWTYNGEKLEEPYGQVGYLDFLSNRYRESGVKVYGVAVDSRIVKNKERPATIRSIRKLQDFMNLSYDLTIDDGTLLDRFGDPRAVGAKLPLWVVIAPDGRVAHYHAGFHTVERQTGLKALDDVVSNLN
jgi:peroxiredoxin